MNWPRIYRQQCRYVCKCAAFRLNLTDESKKFHLHSQVQIKHHKHQTITMTLKLWYQRQRSESNRRLEIRLRQKEKDRKQNRPIRTKNWCHRRAFRWKVKLGKWKFYFLFFVRCIEQLLLLKIAVMTLPSRKKIRALVMKGGEKENEVKLIENWRHRWQQCYHPNMPMWMFVNCFPIFGPTKCCDFPDCLAPANQQVYHKFGAAYERNDESENNRVKIGLVLPSFYCQNAQFRG